MVSVSGESSPKKSEDEAEPVVIEEKHGDGKSILMNHSNCKLATLTNTMKTNTLQAREIKTFPLRSSPATQLPSPVLVV